MTKHARIPLYQVEFIPLERRLGDRRHNTSGMACIASESRKKCRRRGNGCARLASVKP